MERELCLVLDGSGQYRLVLKKGTIAEIDEYTSKHFESDEDIIKRFQKEIDEFLASHKLLLQKNNIPNYKGRLSIVLPEKIGSGYTEFQRAILLKKHMVVFKKYIKDKPVMVQFVSNYGKKFSKHFLRSVYGNWDINRTKSVIEDWLKELKQNKDDYYDMVRNFIVVYQNSRNSKGKSQYKLNIPTIDSVYEEYKSKKVLKRVMPIKLERSKHDVIDEKMHIVNGNSYTIDELEQFDLDDNAEYESEIIPDGLGGNVKKIK